MLSVKLICVGRMRERFYIDAFAEYEKRLRTLCRFELAEITEQRLPDNPSQADIRAALDKEAAEILNAIPPDAYVTALCVEGRQMPSEGGTHIRAREFRQAKAVLYNRRLVRTCGQSKAAGRYEAQHVSDDVSASPCTCHAC